MSPLPRLASLVVLLVLGSMVTVPTEQAAPYTANGVRCPCLSALA
jgi:hypothetical protein